MKGRQATARVRHPAGLLLAIGLWPQDRRSVVPYVASEATDRCGHDRHHELPDPTSVPAKEHGLYSRNTLQSRSHPRSCRGGIVTLSLFVCLCSDGGRTCFSAIAVGCQVGTQHHSAGVSSLPLVANYLASLCSESARIITGGLGPVFSSPYNNEEIALICSRCLLILETTLLRLSEFSASHVGPLPRMGARPHDSGKGCAIRCSCIPNREVLHAMQRPEASTPSTDAPHENAAFGGESRSKARRIVFRIVASITALWLLALNIFGLVELVVMWLPGDTLSSMFGDEFSEIHRAHFMIIGVTAWALVVSLVIQLRKPERRVAPMLWLVISAVAGTIVFGLSGTLGEWLREEILFVLLPIGMVASLHPKRGEFFGLPVFDRPMGYLAAAATIPWLVYVVDNAGLQLANAAGDAHAEMEHWALAALLGIMISAAAFLGSSDHRGWRLSAWIAVGATGIFGVHSLVFPGLASTLPPFWAILAVVWAVAFGVATVRRPRVAEIGQTV